MSEGTRHHRGSRSPATLEAKVRIRGAGTVGQVTDERPTPRPRPSHPKVPGLILIVGTVVLLVALAAMSTFRG